VTLLHIPFVGGQSDTIDSKLAPLGVLKLVQNGRLDRQGRIEKRRGFGLGSLALEYGGQLSTTQLITSRGAERVAVADDRVNAWLPNQARWRQWNYLPRVGVPRRYAGSRNSEGDATGPSIAISGDLQANRYACLVFENPLGVAQQIQAIIYDVTTWTIRSVATLSQAGVRPRVVTCGNRFIATWVSTALTNIEFASFDTNTVNATWSASAILTATGTANCRFDASPYSTTGFLVAHETAGASAIRIVYYDSAGVTLDQKTIIVVGAPAICGTSGEGATLAWCETGGAGDVKVLSYQFAAGSPFGGAAVGPTIVGSSVYNTGYPLICRKSATVHTVGWCVNEPTPDAGGTGSSTRFREVTTASHALGSTLTRYHTLAVSKAAYISDRLYWLGINESTFDRTVFMLSHSTPAASGFGDELIETTMARSAARAFDATHQYSDLFTYPDAEGTTQVLTAFPFLQSGSVKSADPFVAIDIAAIPFGGSKRLQTAEVGGLLYLSGGLLSTFDGQNAHELGWLAAPKIYALTGQAGAGALTLTGTYRYLMTREWYDTQGGRWMSQVSDEATVTLTGGQNQVRIDYQDGSLSNRRRMWSETAPVAQPDPRDRIYFWRTENNGTVFRRITDDDGIDGRCRPSLGNFTVDQMSDATLVAAGNPIVYTQGQRGSLSGPLQHDPPPPCRYIWPGKNRMIVGGLEDPSAFRVSKFFFPGEPVTFSEDFAFRGRVPGEVTAVAYLDDTAIVFTEDRIFAVPGEGPDDSGVNPVGDPVAIPSECGCIDWRSLVETPLGLMFQGRNDRIYLLPRGLGAPVWIGEPVHDTLALYPTIASARLIPEESLVVFVCNGFFVSRNLVYDLAHGAWSVDTLIGGGSTWQGTALWDGLLAQHFGSGYYVERATPYSDEGVWYGLAVETHALRPHGMQADGRTRKVAVLGEFRGTADLRIELAVDDAQAYAHSAQWALPDTEVLGDPVRREWRLPVQKFGSCRLKISEVQTGGLIREGFRLTGLTIETQPRQGLPKLGAARRAS
jgi:hypothetical protein